MNKSNELVLYLAVLPQYRRACIEQLRKSLGERLTLFVSDSHLDPSVTTGIPPEYYERTHMVRILGGRAFVQVGGWRRAVRAEVTVVDLNPRSISAWTIAIVRRLLKRRTLMWGHLYPRLGKTASSNSLRTFMRRSGQGAISYTYSNGEQARRDLPSTPVWVAPNSLYPRSDLTEPPHGKERTSVIYVGRFTKQKRVSALIAGFAEFALTEPAARLLLVGDGQERSALELLVSELGMDRRVDFLGWVDDFGQLQSLYEGAFCSASPGFAGLGLTQSLGFGVPMVVAEGEPHSPEIELSLLSAVRWYGLQSERTLPNILEELWATREVCPDKEAWLYIRDRYSADAMADGIRGALLNETDLLVGDTR